MKIKEVIKINEGKVSIECDTLEQYRNFKRKAEKAGYIIEKEKIQNMFDSLIDTEICMLTGERNYFITFILKKIRV